MKLFTKMARNKKVLKVVGVSIVFVLLLPVNIGKNDDTIGAPTIESDAFMETEDLRCLTVSIEPLNVENIQLSLMQKTTNEQTTQTTEIEVIEEETIIQEQTTEEVRNYSESNLYWLSRAIMAEAEGASYKCKVWCGLVVMNRVNSKEFPNTIYEVLFQPGQYESATNGRFDLEPNEDSIRAAKEILSGTTEFSMPENVVYQSQYEYLGSGVWAVEDGQYFNFR